MGEGATPFDVEKKNSEISIKFQIDAQDFENLLQIAQKSEHFDQHILRILTASLSTKGSQTIPIYLNLRYQCISGYFHCNHGGIYLPFV